MRAHGGAELPAPLDALARAMARNHRADCLPPLSLARKATRWVCTQCRLQGSLLSGRPPGGVGLVVGSNMPLLLLLAVGRSGSVQRILPTPNRQLRIRSSPRLLLSSLIAPALLLVQLAPLIVGATLLLSRTRTQRVVVQAGGSQLCHKLTRHVSRDRRHRAAVDVLLLLGPLSCAVCVECAGRLPIHRVLGQNAAVLRSGGPMVGIQSSFSSRVPRHGTRHIDV